ncbi:CHAD domain-containing protein [Streptomyces sp. NPDC000345]|uniref:CHAD domain-containing protein n=1 Tax=Streptomyces sp. NPDC000345 TaxID=3364537 RepID=UPI0036C6ABA4
MAQRHHDLTGPAAGPAPALGSARGEGPPTGEALAGYLRAQATDFLRALRLHRETGGGTSLNGSWAGGAAAPGAAGGAEEAVDAARALRRTARRISGSLHTFRPLLDPEWSEQIRPELAWLSGTLALEHAYGARLERLLLALHRLSGTTPVPAPTLGAPTAGPAQGAPAGTAASTAAAGRTGHGTAAKTSAAGPAAGTSAPGAAAGTSAAGTSPAGAAAGSRAAGAAPVPAKAAPVPAKAASAPGGGPTTVPAPDRGNLTVGAAKAGALLDRQLTLARTRAHSTALQALGSSRFHAVADKVAVLASEVPLTPGAATTDLRPLAAAAEERLVDAVAALPLVTAGSPYNAEALVHGLSPDPAPHPQDAPWHQVRLLLRLHRYACEVLHGRGTPLEMRLITAGQALDRHRDASEAAAAAAQAARTPRIAPATAYALGVLHADQRHEVEAARYAFQHCWQKQTVSTP